MNIPQGGLQLPDMIASVGAAKEAAIHSNWDTYALAKDHVEMELGFPPPAEPQVSPPNITLQDLEANGKDYTDRYLALLHWFNYAQEKEAEAESWIIQFENEMKQIAATMREAMRERSGKTNRAGERKAPPAAEMEDKIRLNERYLELNTQLQYHTHVKKLVQAKREGFEAKLKLMSRQVEIKRLDYEKTNRGGNMQGDRGIPTTNRPPRGMRE